MAVEIEELLAPIEDENPAGEDVSYEPDYGQIGHLRDDRRGERDFEQIIEIATRILREQSKDLTVAIWLTEALLRTEGYGGLETGLRLVDELMERYDEDLYPRESEDRAFALEFLGDGLRSAPAGASHKEEPTKLVPLTEWGHTLFDYREWKGFTKDSFDESGGRSGSAKGDEDSDYEPSGENFEDGLRDTHKSYYKELRDRLAGCREVAGDLEERAKKEFSEGPIRPSFSNLKESLESAASAVKTLLEAKLEVDPDPPREAEPEADGAPAGEDEPEGETAEEAPAGRAAGDEGSATATPSRSPATKSLAAEPTDAADADARVASAARFLRRADPTDPAPYVLLRGYRWGELRRSGEQVDARMLEAPPTELRTRLKSLLLDGEWADLLDACEEVMATPRGRGWLDLQRYVLTAVEGLGHEYREVGEAIQGQLALLLRDRPALLDATLMDDSPTANRETRSWLERTSLVEGGDGERDDGERGEELDRERVLSEATHRKAMEWVASGNPRRGIQLLMKRADHEESERAKFITESLAASIMVDAGLTSVARPLLEDMVELIEKRNLDEWECAEVVARPIGLLYRTLPPEDRRRTELYDRICRLDPVQAIALEEGSGDGADDKSDDEASDEDTDGAAEAGEDRQAVDSGSSDSEG